MLCVVAVRLAVLVRIHSLLRLMCSLPASKSPLRPRLCLPLAAYSTLSRLQHASGISLVDDARAPLSENAHGGGALVTVRAAEDDGTYVEQVSREFLSASRLGTG